MNFGRIGVVSAAVVTSLAAVSQACQPTATTIAAQAIAGLPSCTPCAPGELSAISSQSAPTEPIIAAGTSSGLLIDAGIIDFSFNPPSLTIPLDTAVRWTNLGNRFHTVTSTAVPPLFDSSTLDPAGIYQYTFAELGTEDYECQFHFGMDGTVIVRAPGDATGDNTVDISDFAVLAGNFNQPGNYNTGDFNVDAQVDIGDFAILAGNFNRTFSGDLPRGAAVPEPGAALASLALICLGIRRRHAASGKN